MMRPSSVRILLATTALLLGLLATAQAADPSGNWKWTITAPTGEFEISFAAKVDGEKLTGTVTRDTNTTAIMDGKFKDGEVSFTVVRERDGQKFTSKYKGKLDGDAIKGTIDVDVNGDTFNFEWNAKREKK